MESLSFMILSIMSCLFLNLSIATTVSSPSQLDTSNLLLQLNDLLDTSKLMPAFTAKESTFPYYLSSCKDPEVGFESKNGVRSNKCCLPPSTKQVKDYKLVKPQVPRKRQPLHKASFEYLNKFKEAIEKMKALPNDDPRSFNNQAKLHCAYSNGIYPLSENGEPGRELKIHNSWLFFPFHRWYLYFFERILGELINDSTFALPYWNWDNRAGMEIPAMFDRGIDNAFYDSYRNPNHRGPAVVDLDYGTKDRYISRVDQIRINLALMNRQMIRNAADTVSFFGGHEIVGDDGIPLVDSTVGSIESGCHTGMHLWVGNSDTPNNEDMGSLLSAGYDPLFYVHHANVDRMWTLWKDLDESLQEPTEGEWKNESYVFFNEKGDLVRVYNQDSVNLENLGYEYEVSETPWTKYVPKPRCNKSGIVTRAMTVNETHLQINPLKINEIVHVHVPRPANHKLKVSTKEMLVIDKVKYNVKKLVKFNIIVNGCDEYLTKITPRDSEYAGCFTNIPQNLGDERFEESGVKLGLSELLKETQCDNKDYILLTFVPILGCDDVEIASIKIEMTDISQKD